MASKVFKPVAEIIDNYSGLARKVLDYSVTVKGLADECKQPGFKNEKWDELFSEFFDKENFLRIGHLKEEMDYPAYVEFQTKWAPVSDWECSFKRITEEDNVVFLELEERATVQGYTNVVNTLSVYEFNSEGKFRHIDVYLQQLPQQSEEIPEAYK